MKSGCVFLLLGGPQTQVTHFLVQGWMATGFCVSCCFWWAPLHFTRVSWPLLHPLICSVSALKLLLFWCSVSVSCIPLVQPSAWFVTIIPYHRQKTKLADKGSCGSFWGLRHGVTSLWQIVQKTSGCLCSLTRGYAEQLNRNTFFDITRIERF